MKRVIHIALTDCRLIIRDRTFLIWSVLLPLVFVFVFTRAFSGSNQQHKSYLAIVNQDSGKWGAYFIDKLHRPDMKIEVMPQEPARVSRVLLIPSDFSQKISDKSAQELRFKTRSQASIESATQAEVTIIQATIQILAEIVLHPDAGTFFDERRELRQLIAVKSEFPPGTLTQVPSGYDHQVPGTMINFLLMNGIIAGAITVAIERKKRMLSRIISGPVSKTQLWLGKFGGRLLVAMVQATILLTFGKFAFHMRLVHLGHVALVVFFFSLAVTALALMIGSLISKEEMIVGVAILLANLMSALGGCWWPIEIVSRPVRLAGMVFPSYWAMDGFHKIIFFRQGLDRLLPNLAILFAFTLLFSFFSIRYFKIRN